MRRNAVLPSVTHSKKNRNDMYKKNEIVYSDAYKYLRRKSGDAIGFAIPGDIDDFEELDIDMRTVKRETNDITLNGRLKIFVQDFDHKTVKMKIVTSRYSNDDQIAVMLNGDEVWMDRMQRWRRFADDVAKAVEETQ